MKSRILRFALIAAVALAIPTVVVLGHGPSDKGKSHANAHATLPDNEDQEQPSDNNPTDKSGERPHNHGWFVSQVARDHSTTGRAHGEAVSKVARGDDGKPDAAH